MPKKRISKPLIGLGVLVGFLLLVSGYFYYTNLYAEQKVTSPVNVSDNAQPGQFKQTEQDDEHLEEEAMKQDNALPNSPQAQKVQEKKDLVTQKEANNPSDKSKPFNILILGIDRRTGDQTSWRTDVIQLLTVNKDRNKVVMTHIPRDVWAGKYKINAVYNLEGPDAIKNAVEGVTGFRPDRIIRIDFDAIVELVDAAGGVDIDVPVGFTDHSYPNDRKGKNEAITITFKQGKQKMNGESALMYSRSRKGDNGTGSDYDRGNRQQLVIEAAVAGVFRPGNLFEPKTAQKIFSIVTKSVYTDISLADAGVMLEVAKNYSNIKYEHISLDTNNYLEHPDNKNYGGQWVLIPKNGVSSQIKEAINKLL